jgi:signal transduction histidine kinase
MKQAVTLQMDTSEALRQIRSHWLSRTIHDFRGPLFAARGYAKLMADGRGGEVTATQREYLEHILNSIHKITKVVDAMQHVPADDCLQLSKVDLTALIQSALPQVETLRAHVTLPPQSISTIADAQKLGLAMHKMLTLAVKFSESGGEFDLCAQQDDGEFTLRITASRIANDGETTACPAEEIACISETLRLHGGVAHVDQVAPDRLRATIRLPIVNCEFQQVDAGR